LQESSSRVLENCVNWGLYIQLWVTGEIGTDAKDLRGGIGFDVSFSVEVSRGVDLVVSKVCQGSRREVLGCTISMAVENVDAEDGLLRLDEWQQGRNEEELFGKHPERLSLVKGRSMNKTVKDARQRKVLMYSVLQDRKKKVVMSGTASALIIVSAIIR
jgi:hypothetical protein